MLGWDRTEAAAGRAGSHQGRRRRRLRVRNECGAGGMVRRACHRAEGSVPGAAGSLDRRNEARRRLWAE